MIKLQVIGRLGKDATVKNLEGGKKVINFSVAHTNKYTDSNGKTVEQTIWVDCAKWGDNVKVAEYMTKGTQVFVEGTPEVRTFERSDGSAGASLSCRVSNIQLLGGNTKGESSKEDEAEEGDNVETADANNEDEVPFPVNKKKGGKKENKTPF